MEGVNELKTIDVGELAGAEFYKHMVRVIVPRPIAWVSTRSTEGIDNLAPFSYFTGVGSRPPTLLFCPANRRDGQPKDTLANIMATRDFVVNVVTDKLVRQMNVTAVEAASDESEFELAGLEMIESERVNVARVQQSPVQIECRLRDVIHVGEGPGGANIVLGDVLLMHIDPAVTDPDGFVDPVLLDVVGRMGGLDYCRTRERFELPRPA